ncbi:MAG: gliding motility-associated C-terminal domain-containing protein [Bacteroidota bacterium]
MKEMRVWCRVLLLITVGLLTILEVKATHIRAGEIIARRVSNSSLEYEFTIIGYTDTGSSVQFGGGEVNFGDGTIIDILEDEVFFQETIDIGDEIAVNTFRISHTFQAPGTYTIRFREFNRNAGIVNMDNSVDTPFYIETQIRIDPSAGLNNTPVLLAPPVDKGAVGARYIHNPAAFDPDGDSLSYHVVIPRQDVDIEVANYRFPNAPEFYQDFQNGREDVPGPPIFRVDSITGDVIWDAPGAIGEYNFAFIIREWRQFGGEWRTLGYVTRDMQVIIEESDNQRPVIAAPPDLCVEAGTFVSEFIQASDPDGHPVRMEAFGGPFELSSSPAMYSPNPPTFQNSPALLRFDWQTDCRHVRERPYEVQIKATDDPDSGPRLAEFATWNITVVAPAPKGVEAQVLPGKQIQIDWDSYECFNAATIEVWRRVDSYDFDPDECQIGIPANAGYQRVGELDRTDTTFLDTNNGIGLAPGATYCYRLVAAFPLPAGGTSYASMEVCETIAADAPVITNASVEETSETDGIVRVAWTPPLEVDDEQFPPPYSYEVIRYIGADGLQEETRFPPQADTVFFDSGINTKDNVYSYRIRLFDGLNNFVDSSASASTVRLEVDPRVSSIALNWSARVPWSNNVQDFPTHFIYRDNVDDFNPDEFVLIDEVNVNFNGFNYFDDGDHNGVPLDDEVEYCYFVTTQGSYGNPIIMEPLLNNSQIICGQPNDLVPPCAPVTFRLDESFNCEMFLAGQSCGFRDFENRLVWEMDDNSQCDDDLRSYNIYFSESGEEDAYVLIDNVETEFYAHTTIRSYKGCYRIASVDRSGNESELTEPVCNDNCPNYLLPNVFTPNDDGVNDAFGPFYSDGEIIGFDFANCPRFVESVLLRIYDRTGKEIFEYESNEDLENGIFINWNGETNGGSVLESGTYFYHADVTYDVLDPANRKEEIRGWVQLLK